MKQAKLHQRPPTGTWYSFIRSQWPGVNAEWADRLLWSCSAYPMAPLPHVVAQLRKAAQRSHRKPRVALDKVYRAIDRVYETAGMQRRIRKHFG